MRVRARTQAVPGSSGSARGGDPDPGPEEKTWRVSLEVPGNVRPDFERLVRNAQSGDRAALTNVLVSVYADLLSYLVRLCGERHLAEDLGQETMVRVITSLGRYRLPPGDARGRFRAWVLTIATNLYRDHLRKSSRLLLVERVSGESVADVEESALGALRYRQVLSALMKIAWDLRVAFVRRDERWPSWVYRCTAGCCWGPC